MLAKSCELTYPFIFKSWLLFMSICVIRSLSAIPCEAKQGVVTLGNFDGVHIGHQLLLERTVEIARKTDSPSIVVTFHPHPVEYFSGKKTLPRLSFMREKALMMQQVGIDYLIVIPFNQVVASKPANDFIRDVLHEALSVKHIVIGDNFRFGHKRQGDVALLKALSSLDGFSVEAMPQRVYQGTRVSSTSVREALKCGDLVRASHLLGRAYTVSGHVQYGKALGRKLGFRTLNLAWRGEPPLMGIYTVWVHGVAKTPLPGVASSGTRPTIDGTQPLLEVHLLDFDQLIYGKRVTVEFCHKLRDEEYFESLDALTAQIAVDVLQAKAYFMGKA